MPSDYKQIADEHRQGYGAFDHHLEGYEDFYSDDTHFIYELIQNAQDAIATDPCKDAKGRFLRITLRDEELVASNDGLAFAEQHVRAICSIRQSTKDLGQIGAHGIGFKAVGKFTSAPEIYSGDERFRIHRRVEPQIVEDVPHEFLAAVEAGCTIFRLPFKPDIGPDELDRLGERLPHIHKWALLFLHDLRRVEWKDERRGKAGQHSCAREPHPTIPNAVIARICSELDGEIQAEETFLCFSRHQPPPQAVVDEMCRQAKTEKERTKVLNSCSVLQPVEIAFALRRGVISPIEGSLLFAFLPTRKETHLRFLMQAHYKTTFVRDDIRDLDNSAWNRWLVEETAAFVPEVLQHLKAAGLWTPSAFDILPAPSDDVPDGEGKANVLQPILKATLQALTESELIVAVQISLLTFSYLASVP